MPGSALARPARRIGAALLDLLLPRYCVACDRALASHDTGVICGVCWVRVPELPQPQCERCGHPANPHGCRWCEQLPAYVRAVRSVCWVPGGTGRAIVHALKYSGWRDAAVPMAARMARLAWPADVMEERTALVPVPLAPVRERERGYNQSELLARALGNATGVPVWSRALVRARATRSQTRLTPDERRSNVAGAFRVGPDMRLCLRGAHIVLVDDVVTTGATLGQCAAALFAAGTRIVSYVTFGRAPAAGDRPSLS